jgi:hypothetical protein
MKERTGFKINIGSNCSYYWSPYVECGDIRPQCICISLKLYTTMGRISQNGDILANGIHLPYGHVGPMTHSRCLGQQSPCRTSGTAETEEKQNKRSKLITCP